MNNTETELTKSHAFPKQTRNNKNDKKSEPKEDHKKTRKKKEKKKKETILWPKWKLGRGKTEVSSLRECRWWGRWDLKCGSGLLFIWSDFWIGRGSGAVGRGRERERERDCSRESHRESFSREQVKQLHRQRRCVTCSVWCAKLSKRAGEKREDPSKKHRFILTTNHGWNKKCSHRYGREWLRKFRVRM